MTAPWPVDQPIPAAVTVEEVCRITRISQTQFYAWKRCKSLPPYIKPLPHTGSGRRLLYCGLTLAAWVRGEAIKRVA